MFTLQKVVIHLFAVFNCIPFYSIVFKSSFRWISIGFVDGTSYPSSLIPIRQHILFPWWCRDLMEATASHSRNV